MSKKYYNRTNICDMCGKNFDVPSSKPHREYNKEGNWTGRWLCKMCWYHNDYKMRPNEITRRRDILSVADHRTGNLDPNSSQAKGGLFEELTSIWRSTVSTIPVENLNKKLDNYTTPIDHSRDSELGIIQTKGCLYGYLERKWYQNFKSEHSQITKGFKFDNLILYCASKDGMIIERIYIFPIEEILERSSISITKNPTDRWGNSITPWYEYNRIKDGKIVNKINEIWQKIIEKKNKRIEGE